MTRAILVYFPILGVAMGSCVKPKLTMDPDYPAGSISGGRLAVFFDPPLPRIDIGPYPGENIEQVYTGFFRENFPALAKLHTNLNDVVFRDLVVNLPDKRSLSSSSGNTFVRLPESGTQIVSDSVDYVLIVEDFHMYRSDPATGKYSQNKSASGAPQVQLNATSDDEMLIHEFVVAIWDNARGRLMAHGSLLVRHPIASAITEESWLDALREIAFRIFDGGPFKQR